MHQIIQLCDAITATVETRATGFIRLSLDHPVIDLQRADMTASQALALSRALLLAHDIKAGTECAAFVSNAGEGAQGGHPQRYPDGKCQTRPECMDTKCKGLCHLADSRHMQSGASAYLAPSEAGRINWLALIMLGALAGFWVSFGMAIKTAIQAGAVVL